MTRFEQVVLTTDEREAHQRRDNNEVAVVAPLHGGRWAVFVGLALTAILPDGNALIGYLTQHFEANQR